ncbi:hypothetical protein [Paenibacillus hamazuiensis]|uniref:hypothetical protein n=1 Tax=Paenibacillus hamazuiensis TaxID=2936508 RepID=UPI00200CCF96|nr:hypothetical protein [Paenibacillus hamazuiensis]
MKRKPAVYTLLLLTCMLASGCWYGTKPQEIKQTIGTEVKQAVDEAGDLVVASDDTVYSVDSKTQQMKPILRTAQPISHMGYTNDHLLVTVYNPKDAQAFKGFYLRDKDSNSFSQIATPQMSPKFCYIYGDLAFFVSADKTPQKGGDYTKVGIYQLASHKWVKEWLVPGGIEDMEGRGKDVYFVTDNDHDTSSNLYKADLTTGDWGKMIQEARRYPLDEVAVDTNGDVYMMIAQRTKSEWSNKVYRFNPQQTPYDLFSNFISNTKPFSYSMAAMNGKGLILRNDLTATNDIEKPIALLDLSTRKQVFLEWDHRPVSVDRTADEFAILADDGAIEFVKPDLAEPGAREVRIEGLASGKFICVKKDGT